jgi:DNA modification methylase
MEMKIKCAHTELVDVDLLMPNPKNPNKHPDNQLQLLAKIMGHQGWRSPIVVSTRSGFITKGHGRLIAAKINGWTQAPVDRQEYATEADEYADMVADNKIAELAETDMTMVNRDVLDLGADFDLDLLGIPDFQLVDTELLEPKCDEDDLPEHVEPRAKLGDIYQLGRHRLMCGDATSATDLDSLMNSMKANMIFTDPPYGVDYTGGHNEKKRLGIKNDALAGQELTDLFGDSLSLACAHSEEHAAFYIWYANGKAVETFGSFSKLPLKVRAVICWYKVKSGLGAFMSQYIPNYEPCIYAFKEGCSPQWFGPTDEKTVWELKRESKNEFHPTQKPVELSERAIVNSSKPGDIVLDMFGGSGATLISCEKNDRKCFMMELDPHYIDVIVARWEKYTGKKAELLNV